MAEFNGTLIWEEIIFYYSQSQNIQFSLFLWFIYYNNKIFNFTAAAMISVIKNLRHNDEFGFSNIFTRLLFFPNKK